MHQIVIDDYITQSGAHFKSIFLSYEWFGKKLGTAPVVLVNHALTGNSKVAGTEGWWNQLIGENKVIDTSVFTVLCFNIPGNGYDGVIIENYTDLIARDIAQIFLIGLKKLNISKLHSIIGGSLGGGIAWEMATLNNNITQNLIPVASDWKSTDWLIANCKIQELFLNHSTNPVSDARMHAMLCYRTPMSFKQKFNRSKNQALHIFNIESWLIHHGDKLQKRFQLASYKLMNHLLKTIDATQGKDEEEVLKNISAHIHIIGVNSDLFFTVDENLDTYDMMASIHPHISYSEINSNHGHDAFLIENQQLNRILEPIFTTEFLFSIKEK